MLKNSPGSHLHCKYFFSQTREAVFSNLNFCWHKTGSYTMERMPCGLKLQICWMLQNSVGFCPKHFFPQSVSYTKESENAQLHQHLENCHDCMKNSGKHAAWNAQLQHGPFHSWISSDSWEKGQVFPGVKLLRNEICIFFPAIPENREIKKWKFSFFHQRHELSTSFDIFVVTYL